MLLDKLGGRKFVLALIVLIIGTVVQLKSATGVTESFVALLVGITAAFGASNAYVSSKAISADADASSSEPPPQPVDLSPVESRIAALEEQLNVVDVKSSQVAEGLLQVAESVEKVGKVAKAALTVSKQGI